MMTMLTTQNCKNVAIDFMVYYFLIM